MSLVSRLVVSLVCGAAFACSSNVKTGGSTLGTVAGAGPGGPSGTAGATGSIDPIGPGSAGSGITLNVDAGVIDTSGAGAGGGAQIITMLPPGYDPTELGGFKLGDALGGGDGAAGSGGASAGTGGGSNGNCGNVLLGVVRDFRRADEASSNQDFESPIFWGNDITPNLVAATIGADQKPVYASKCELGNVTATLTCPYGAETTTQGAFDQWYRDTPSVNLPFAISLYLAPQSGGVFTFQSLHYFPLDDAGFGASGKADDGLMHNFGFTTEIHTQFNYTGGESFQFQGDDDVWVFINGKMTVDLGGLHPRMTGTVDLDASAATLGIEKGKVYSLDLFHAERHTDKSTFRIDTNLSFVNCGTTESGPK